MSVRNFVAIKDIVPYYCRSVTGFLKLGEVVMWRAAAASWHLLFCKNLGDPAPPASNASLMPYLCSRFYADSKSDSRFCISTKLTTSIELKSVTYHATLLKFHTSPWDFFQQDQLWLKNQCIHRQLFPQCQNCQNQASIDKFLEIIIKNLDIVILSSPVVPF